MKTISLQKLLLRIFAIIVVSIAAFTFVAERLARQNVHDLIINAVSDLSDMNVEQIDRQLSNMDSYLASLFTYSYDVSTLALSTNAEERYKVSRNIILDLERCTAQYPQFSSVFLISDSPSGRVYLSAHGRASGTPEQFLLKSYTMELPDTGHTALERNTWTHQVLDGTSYLFRMVGQGSTYCGAWVRTDELLSSIREANLISRGSAFFVDSDGQVLGFGDEPWFSPTEASQEIQLDGTSYIQVNRKSRAAPITLVLLFPQSEVNRPTVPVSRLFAVLGGSLMLVVVAVARLLQQQQNKPIQSFVHTMRRFGQNEITVRADEHSGFQEIQELSHSFNQMADQIQHLKISAYENQIKQQEAQLQYLQTQIRPHFFLNTLNIIYSFAEVKEYRYIQEMTSCLVQYFRYILSGATFTTLAREAEHARNYMKIQSFRYPGNFLYEEELQPDACGISVPVLIIQAFLENSIKYALDVDRENTIRLSARRTEEHLHLTLADSGPGFPAGLLARLTEGGSVNGFDGENHTGIDNIRNRLDILYTGQAEILFSNGASGGAVVHIRLPAGQLAAKEE